MRERPNSEGRDRTRSSNRRDVIRKIGASGVGLTIAGSGLSATAGRAIAGDGVSTDDNTGGGGSSCDSIEMNLGEQFTMRTTDKYVDDVSNITYYADNKWMLGLIGQDGDQYRFSLSSIYNHHFDHEVDGLGGLGWQEEVKTDAAIKSYEDSFTTIGAFGGPDDERNTISGWDDNEWQKWWDDEEGKSYSESEIESKLGSGDPDYEEPDYPEEWFSLISFVGGIGTAVSGGALAIGGPWLSLIAGGASLALTMAEAEDDGGDPETDTDNGDDIYYWWPYSGGKWALSITSHEFCVDIGSDESAPIDLHINQSFDETFDYDTYLSDAGNLCSWHVKVPEDGTKPEICTKSTSYTSGGHAHF